jgi:hypothetical protein
MYPQTPEVIEIPLIVDCDHSRFVGRCYDILSRFEPYAVVKLNGITHHYGPDDVLITAVTHMISVEWVTAPQTCSGWLFPEDRRRVLMENMAMTINILYIY